MTNPLSPLSVSPPRRQRGAALVVGLVLLLVLTLLGVSGLGTATTEVRLADNKKQRELSIQAAESAVNEAILTGGRIAIDTSVVENQTVRSDYVVEIDHIDADGSVAEANVNVTVQTRFRGVGDVPANSTFSRAYEIGTFQAIHFVAHGDAEGQRGARASVRRGYYIPAPNP
ncbi:MAG: PilX N-terminal domain-containing pilus assembly protein [Pseudomonadota bacterium]